MENKCALCGKNCEVKDYRGLYKIFDCSTCGSYIIEEFPISELEDRNISSQKFILSGITRNAYEEGRTVTIKLYNIQQLLQTTKIPQGPIEKIDRLLFYIYKKSGVSPLTIVIGRDYPLIFSRDKEEFSNILRITVDEGLLKIITLSDIQYQYQLTLKAINRIDEIKRKKRETNQVFVAMSFDPALNEAWEKGIRPALEETGYKPVRLDYLDHNEKIDDKQILEIRKSSILIADLTRNNQGVYFEAGFALGLNIPVIWTCNRNSLDEIHFDTRQYNYIIWETPEQLRQKLKNRIEANYPLDS